MSEKLSSSPENVELHQSTTPGEILDFEARLAEQQEALAAAQASVDELNFKSDAMDRVKAQADLREAKAAYDENMANLNDEWLKHGGERLENARLAAESLDFKSDALDRVKAKTELRDAESAWSESYNAEKSSGSVAEELNTDKIDEIADNGINKINDMTDEHMQAIEAHAEKASAEIREATDDTSSEIVEVESAGELVKKDESKDASDEVASTFDLDAEIEKSKQKLHESADQLEAAAQKRFIENNTIDTDHELESAQEEVPSDELIAAKQALEYQDRSDEASPEEDTTEFEDYEIPTSSEFVDDEADTSEEKDNEDDSSASEFGDTEPESESEKDTTVDESETEDGEFVDDDEEETEEDKKRFGKMRSFISSMRKKAGIASVKAYNSVMDGFGSIGGRLTTRNEGELDEAYEKRKKTVGLLTVAAGALALSAVNRFGGGDHFGGFEGFGSGDSGNSGAEGASTTDLGHIDAEPAPDIDTGGADNSDFDHDNTPEVDGGDWNGSATTVDNGEGWYQTFEDMGIPKDEWNDLLQKVGPELKSEGYAYTMPDGSYGISKPGQLPVEVLDMIEQSR